jgi:glutathione S-transferase
MAEAAYELVIGSKQVSSWSLRPWLLMRQAGLAFTETLIELRRPDTRAQILKHSPSGQVPLLKHGSFAVWDSLAIAEYLHERHPQARLWPADATARAIARCVAAEMHSSYREMRYALPMEFMARGLSAKLGEAVEADIARIVALWCDARRRFGAQGPFLFGTFSIADAMFAPVVSRFTSYGIDLAAHGDTGEAEPYRAMLMALPAMAEWGKGAKAEPAYKGP